MICLAKPVFFLACTLLSVCLAVCLSGLSVCHEMTSGLTGMRQVTTGYKRRLQRTHPHEGSPRRGEGDLLEQLFCAVSLDSRDETTMIIRVVVYIGMD